ncbi:hypothetical protein ACHAXT_003035 [Thalassiosira profunda]
MVLGWGKRAAAPADAEADAGPSSPAADGGHASASAGEHALNISEGGWADDSYDAGAASAAVYADTTEFCNDAEVNEGGPASASMGGPRGAGGSYDYDEHGMPLQVHDGPYGGGGEGGDAATPPLFPPINSSGGDSNAGGRGGWPPGQGGPTKTARAAPGEGAFGGGGGSGNDAANGNGESASAAAAGASPVFQFTSNTAAATAGGGGGEATTTAGGQAAPGVTPQTAAAALNFGKGFAPGAGAQGIAPAPPPDARLPNPVSADPLDSAHSGEGGDDSAVSPAPHAADAGAASTPLAAPNGLPAPWTPQTATSTCEFTHTISNYAQKRDSGCKKAEYSAVTADAHGNKWRLIIYVNGNGRASNHHLSLFLQVADAEELPFGWNKSVSYVLTLEHPRGPNLGYAKRNPDKTFKLCPKAIDWGWSQFITSDRIQREGYVDGNALTVRASVTVKSASVAIDPEDAELYLKCAVEEGNAAAVEVCLERGAGANCQFKDDLYTPLHTACSANNLDGGGSSASPTNSNAADPGPISDGSLEVLDLLLARGADVNATNKWRETPLLIAANNGHTEAVRRLLTTEADPALCSEAGWSALTFGAHKGYDDICALLLAAHAPANCRVTEDLSTPLHKACAGSKPGHVAAVRRLLEDGNADVHALNKWRETPLLTAANHGQDQAVDALLRHGADPCKCTDTGWSPLSIAAYKGHDECVRLLLEDGAPTEEDDPTLSALLQAATKGLPDTCMLLLRHGADHTVTTKKGDTALSILVEQNLVDAAAEMAMEYGASIPRCSRDRKKVQRARLLINLKQKQMQREGTGPYGEDDSSDQGESSDSEAENNGAGRALHDGADSMGAASPAATSKKKKKKKPQKSAAKAEADARAAEEALLMELEAEEVARTAKSEGGGSGKNRKKKLKKKERERKEKEEKERIARAEEEAKERQRKEKEAAQAAAAAAKQQPVKGPSPGKKEKVVELSARTVPKKRGGGTGPPARKGGPAAEASLPSPSHADKKKAAAKKAAEHREAKSKKAREGSLAGGKAEKKGGKAAPPTGRAPPRKIPGDNPVPPRRIPGDNPIPPKKIPGDNPVPPRRIPGDTPKAPQQQSRGPPKPKRGWENKAAGSPPSPPPAPSGAGPQRPRQPPPAQPPAAPARVPAGPAPKEKPGTKAARAAPSGGAPPSSPAEAAPDEGARSPAGSTTESLLPAPQKAAAAAAAPASAAQPLQHHDAASDVLGFLDAPAAAARPPPPPHAQVASPAAAAPAAPPPASPAVELPSVSVYRLEKINELFRRCSEAQNSPSDPLRVIDERTLRVVLYRWIIRASHGAAPFRDPVIPSWEDGPHLTQFLQRQFISEGRRSSPGGGRGGVPSIEAFRDAGSALAELCAALAGEVAAFRRECERQVPPDWTDAHINVAGREEGNNVVIDWSGKSRLSLPYVVFNSLARRYVGDRDRLMSAIFSAVRRHEVMSAIADRTDMLCHLPRRTVECLTKGLRASLETHSDSVAVYGDSYFCAMFPDIDAAFGGLPPFGKERGGGEAVLARAGGSAVVVAPPENATAAQCVRTIVDLSETYANVPLSFGVVLSSDCFVHANTAAALSVEDLRALDPRLCGEKKGLVSFAEVIPAGSCSFSKASGMFLLVQNEAGKVRCGVHPATMDMIRASMRSDVRASAAAPVMSPNVPGVPAEGFGSASYPPVSPAPQHYAAAPQGMTSQGMPVSSNPWGGDGGGRAATAVHAPGGRGGHRGRLFDLVGEEDGADDQFHSVLPGMLDSLNMNGVFGGTFGGNGTGGFGGNAGGSGEVDIEAISLMGIGLNKGNGAGSGQGQGGW